MGLGYKYLTNKPEGIYREKGSKFIGYAIPVRSVEDVKDGILEVRKLHPKSRHACYGYVLGDRYETEVANDDGEPSGTAGKPILNQILSSELTYTLVVVIRYFGGTKLGTTGLIRAYKTAAEEALNLAEFKEAKLMEIVAVDFGYDQTSQVNLVIQKSGGTIIEQKFEMACNYQVAFEKEKLENLEKELKLIVGLKYQLLGEKAV